MKWSKAILLKYINGTFKSKGVNVFCITTMLPLPNKNYNNYKMGNSNYVKYIVDKVVIKFNNLKQLLSVRIII